MNPELARNYLIGLFNFSRYLLHHVHFNLQIHSEPRYLATSSATLSRHPWPSYTTAVPIDQSHQCVYQTLPKTSMAHQPVQTQISVPPVILEKSLSNNSSPLANKQESAVQWTVSKLFHLGRERQCTYKNPTKWVH